MEKRAINELAKVYEKLGLNKDAARVIAEGDILRSLYEVVLALKPLRA
jgi:hypothetical protein